MSNIIEIDKIGWKSEDYEESYLESETHQHLVKVADYVKFKDSESPTALSSSDIQYIGAYEYAPGGWITDHIHSNAEQWYFILNGTRNHEGRRRGEARRPGHRRLRSPQHHPLLPGSRRRTPQNPQLRHLLPRRT